MVKGIPYCIGGAQAPNGIAVSSDKSIAYQMNFDDAVGTSNNYYAGNTTEGGNYVAKTAGLDCSGFVCVVYDVWKSNGIRYNTTGLVSASGPFKRSSTAPSYMQLYIKTGAQNQNHVMIVKGEIYYSVGHGVLPVYESAKSAGRTIENNRDLNALTGYSTAVLR